MWERRLAALAVAIPLALSAINAQAQQAQEADDLPRLGETAAEYKVRVARTRGDRESLREALREKQDKAHFEALCETQERNEAATERYEKSVTDFQQSINDQKARDQRAKRCARSSGAHSGDARL